MTRFAKVIGAIVMLIAVTAVAAEVKSDLYPSAVVHYKMTVVVNTPEGIKIGSAVREMHMYIAPNAPGVPGGPQGYGGMSKGEAVVVDLGKRGKLFALLKNALGSNYASEVFWYNFPWPGGPGGALTDPAIRWYRTLNEGKKILGPKDYPEMITFSNLSDPKTVQVVYECIPANTPGADQRGQKVTDRFEEIFGKGVKLHSVTIEVTQDPVTWGIEKWIPWLPGRKAVPGSLGGTPERPFEDPTKTYLTGVEFSQGRFE